MITENILIAPFSNTRIQNAYETLLEQAEIELRKGSKIDILSCCSELAACDWNPTKKLYRCVSCIVRRRRGENSVTQRMTDVPTRLDAEIKSKIGCQIDNLLSTIRTLDDLESICFNHFDIGAAVYSTLSTWLRDSRFDLDKNSKTIRRLFIGGAQAYQTIFDLTSTGHYKAVLIFNGRLVSSRAALRACQATGTECRVYEVNSAEARWNVTYNAFIHDRKELHQIISSNWENALEPDRTQIAKTFFHEQRQSGPGKGSLAKLDRLIDPFLVSRKIDTKIYVFFTSSEDEFVGIGKEWKSDLFRTQEDAILGVYEILQHIGTPFILIVRIHPNGIKNISERNRFAALQRPYLIIILPEDSVDSYELIEKSSAVITFGSTIGIEATYWQRASATLAPAFYDKFDAVYELKTKPELQSFLLGPAVPKLQAACLPVGFYLKAYGKQFQYFSVSSQLNKIHPANTKLIKDPILFRILWKMFGWVVRDNRKH